MSQRQELSAKVPADSLAEWIDEVADRFEAAWRSGESSSIEVFLGDTPEPGRSELLRELFTLDLIYRKGSGQELAIEEYQRRFPDHVEVIASVIREQHAAAGKPVGSSRVSSFEGGQASRLCHEEGGQASRLCHEAAQPVDASSTSSFSGSGVDQSTTTEPAYVPTPQSRRAETSTDPQIGRYRILETLGEGGMGTVYKAHDPQLARVVALKMPRFDVPQRSQTVLVQRFLREARAAAGVRHPNVCAIHDVGEHNGLPYVVMDYVEGQSLADRLQGSRRFDNAIEAVELAGQVAQALEAVHAHGIIHRDLKPGNILLEEGRGPRVESPGPEKAISVSSGPQPSPLDPRPSSGPRPSTLDPQLPSGPQPSTLDPQPSSGPRPFAPSSPISAWPGRSRTSST